MKQSIPVWTIYAIIVLLILILAAVVVGGVIPQLERSAETASETANAQAQVDRLATGAAHRAETATAAPPSSFGERRTNSAITQTALLTVSATFTPTPTATLMGSLTTATETSTLSPVDATATALSLVTTYQYIWTLQATVNYDIFQISPTPRP